MVVNCQIEFDNNPHGTYFAGQMLTGKVTLRSDKAKQVKGITLKIKGFAHTSWSESHSHTTTDSKGRSRSESHSVTYSGHEDYIASITYLLGSDENQSVTVQPGIHTYTFACHLPLICPSSFEGHYGHVRYVVKVSLIRPWKFDQTFTKGFTVLKIMDLNYDTPLLKAPTNCEVEKVYCCGPCAYDPLKVHVNLPQSGYVPGQRIPVSVLITNNTSIHIQEVTVALVMLVCYYSQSPSTHTKNERTVVAKLKGDPVLRHCKKLLNYSLPVPATPPTCFNLCRLIQIAYQVEVETKVKGMFANQVVCTPVTIGNVPLMSAAAVISAQPQFRSMMGPMTTETLPDGMKSVDVHAVNASSEGAMDRANGEAPPLTPSTPWSADANIPPPSYEEAVHIPRAQLGVGEEHDYGEKEFIPRYPVFDIPSPSAPTMPDEVDGSDLGGGHVNGALEIPPDPDKTTWL